MTVALPYRIGTREKTLRVDLNPLCSVSEGQHTWTLYRRPCGSLVLHTYWAAGEWDSQTLLYRDLGELRQRIELDTLHPELCRLLVAAAERGCGTGG